MLLDGERTRGKLGAEDLDVGKDAGKATTKGKGDQLGDEVTDGDGRVPEEAGDEKVSHR